MATPTKSLSEEKRAQLLTDLSRIEADADISPEGISRVFLQLPEHKRILDDKVVLVLGERGVGKSALFHFLHSTHGRELLSDGSAQAGRTWIVGFSETGSDHPHPQSLELLASEDRARAFWLGHLIGRICAAGLAVPERPAFLERWMQAPTDPNAWLESMGEPTRLLLWLDQLEAALAARGESVIVTYDHLDRIAVRNREIRRRVLPPLLAFWLSLSNRYRRLRAKIFLRHDLFTESVTNTSDASKLLARAEALRWTVPSLYRLLIRHMAAQSSGLREWLDSGTHRVVLREHPVLGWMPPDDLPETGKASSQEAFMAHLVGPRMGDGKDPRSGYTYRWVPSHIEDAHGVIAPRSMITLVKQAAVYALASASPKGRYMRLLDPDELKAGLRKASEIKVTEVSEEHPVIKRLVRLQGLKLPSSMQEMTSLLAHGSDEDDGFRSEGDTVLDELTRLGVLKRLPRDKIDVPEIYRHHFKITGRIQRTTS